MIDKQKQGHIKHTRKHSQCYTHDDTHRLTMTHNETQIIIDKPLKMTHTLKYMMINTHNDKYNHKDTQYRQIHTMIHRRVKQV